MKSEKQEINELFSIYLFLSIALVGVITIVFIVIYIGLHYLLGLDHQFLTPKQVYISRIITGLIFAAYIYATYSTLNSIITAYHTKVAVIRKRWKNILNE